MTRFGYTLMTEQSGPKELVAVRRRRRAGRVRLRGVERPLLPVALRAGPRAVRLDGARRGRAGDRAGRADDLRDLPDHALPPGRRGAEGRDAADPRRRPVHPRPRQRREPQRARRRPGLAGDRRPPGHARARRSRSSASCTRGELVDVPTASTSDVDSARIWDLPEQRRRRSASRSAARQSVERFAPLADHLIAVEPKAELVTAWNSADGAPQIGDGGARHRPDPDLLGPGQDAAVDRARARAVPLVRRRLGGQRRPAHHRPASPGATQFVRPEDVADVHPLRPRPRRDRRGGQAVLGGRVHRRRARPDRRRDASSGSSTRPPGRCWRSCARPPADGGNPHDGPNAPIRRQFRSTEPRSVRRHQVTRSGRAGGWAVRGFVRARKSPARARTPDDRDHRRSRSGQDHLRAGVRRRARCAGGVPADGRLPPRRRRPSTGSACSARKGAPETFDAWGYAALLTGCGCGPRPPGLRTRLRARPRAADRRRRSPCRRRPRWWSPRATTCCSTGPSGGPCGPSWTRSGSSRSTTTYDGRGWWRGTWPSARARPTPSAGWPRSTTPTPASSPPPGVGRTGSWRDPPHGEG